MPKCLTPPGKACGLVRGKQYTMGQLTLDTD
jgi:hypothetical protein